MSARLEGTVRDTVADRGFGFLIGPDSQEYFFHMTDLENCEIRTLSPGTSVSFEGESTVKGLRARKVALRRGF